MTEEEIKTIFEMIQKSSQGIDASDVIAICSAFIALMVLAVTIFEGFQSRKHNRLSVLPAMHFTSSTDRSSSFKLLLSNFGLGPGIINEFEVSINNEKYAFPNRDQIIPALEKIGYKLEGTESSMYLPSKGEAFKEGNEVRIFEFHCGESCTYEKLEKIFKEIKVVAKFRTIYGEELNCSYSHT